jgi:hypothetical protein
MPGPGRQGRGRRPTLPRRFTGELPTGRRFCSRTGSRNVGGRSRLNSGGLLLGLGLIFAIVFGIALGPALTAPFVSFDIGDDIYWKKTTRLIGEVVAYDETHAFPEGATEAAYRIRSGTGVLHWLPAADLHRHGKSK